MLQRALWLPVLVWAAVVSPRLLGYSVTGTRWTVPTVTMHLQLGGTSTSLIDGFASWDASAADALSVWNSHINSSKFAVAADSNIARGPRNGRNNVYFSNTVNGQAWGANVLAVTLTTSSGNRNTETDVLFNSNLSWNSYRGSTRATSSGTIFDFHRVALHEFGHVLGLDHPDTKGQSVSALMNSRITSLDGLTSDDISGAQSIYGTAPPAEPPPTTPTDPTTPTTPPPDVAINSSRLINLSTRAFLPTGGTLTPGFFIRGSGSKSLLIRAVGPTLRRFGVSSALSETKLELLSPGGGVVRAAGPSYQTLSDADVATRVGAFPLDPNARDATTQALLSPEAYTVRITAGDSGMTGVALAEIYDADSAGTEAELVNLSTLGFVGPGEDVLTAGFVISGNGPKRLLIRAIGPGLSPFGVENTLSDPQLALMPQVGAEPIAFNDDWPDTAALRSAFGNAGAFGLQTGSKDAALVVSLQPGAYTAIVSSVTASLTGQALVEIYDLDP